MGFNVNFSESFEGSFRGLGIGGLCRKCWPYKSYCASEERVVAMANGGHLRKKPDGRRMLHGFASTSDVGVRGGTGMTLHSEH